MKRLIYNKVSLFISSCPGGDTNPLTAMYHCPWRNINILFFLIYGHVILLSVWKVEKKISLVKFLTVNSVFYSADKKVIVYESLTVSYDSYISRIIEE